MVYIIDTNIIISAIANQKFETFFERDYLQSNQDEFVISAVTEGELFALALKRKWGHRKLDQLSKILKRYLVHPIKVKSIIDAYAQIDAYSQGVLENKPLPKGMTARNMGKNDIWIAATAHVLKGTLVTTDKDFDHLDGAFFKRDLVNIEDFR